MKRKIKKSWTAIPPILTKRTFTFHLDSLNTKRWNTTYDVEHSSSGVEQTCGGEFNSWR